MSADATPPAPAESARIDPGELADFCRAVLAAAGSDAATAEAATTAMMHGSRLGVDSHGVRLLDHYVRVMRGGRVNPRPVLRVSRGSGAAATLDADDGHGALAAGRAMETAIEIAGEAGLGAVAIRNSSHFGAAGTYALRAAEAGMVGLAFCNSDSFVRLHGGAERVHGTNPIAAAAPNGTARPWLLDMATSAIPYNRILLYRSLGQPLPEDTASTEDGTDTTDSAAATMLAPLGGDFGFKGAGLAGLVEVLSAVLSGMTLSHEILPMPGPDMETPRKLGAFVLALRPGAFVEERVFRDGMARYLAALRDSAAAPGESVLAPGDREWAEEAKRLEAGIPIDPETATAFHALSRTYGVALPAAAGAGTPE